MIESRARTSFSSSRFCLSSLNLLFTSSTEDFSSLYGLNPMFLNTKFMTYDLPNVGLKKVITFPTGLESTTQVLAYGHDLVLARISPDKKFDMVDEDFNFGLLFLAIFLLCVAAYGFQQYLKSKRYSFSSF